MIVLCALLLFFFSCDAAVVTSNSLVSSYQDGVLDRVQRVSVDFYQCGRPGGEKTTFSVFSQFGPATLEAVCLSPLTAVDRTVFSLVPEVTNIFQYENGLDSKPTINVTEDDNDMVAADEFALSDESGNVNNMGRRLMALPDDAPVVTRTKEGVLVQSSVTNRVECFDASFDFLETLRSSNPSRYPANIIGPAFNITSWPALRADRRDTFWLWWSTSIAGFFLEQQLITTLSYRNAVPNAYCEADVFNGYNATAMEAAILSNTSRAYSQTFIDPQSSTCTPVGFEQRIPDPTKILLKAQLASEISRLQGLITTASPSPLEEYTQLLEYLNNPANANATYMVAQEFISDDLFFYDNVIGIIFRDAVRSSLINASGKDGYDIRRDVKYSRLFSNDFETEALPLLRPGDFFEATNGGCKCTLNKYGDQFRTCTLNPWELTSRTTGLVPDQRMGFTQKCVRVKKKFLCAPLIHTSLVRDRGLTTTTKYCGDIGSKATPNTIKMETKDYIAMGAGLIIGAEICGPACAVAGLAVGASVVGITKIVDYYTDTPCRFTYVTSTDQSQRILDTQITEGAIASNSQTLLSWLQGAGGVYTDENGVEQPFNLEGMLGLNHKLMGEVNNVSEILNSQTGAALTLGMLMTQLGIDTTTNATMLQKIIQDLIDVARNEQEQIANQESAVMASTNFLEKLLRSTIESNNATLNATIAMLNVQRTMMKNHTLNFKAFSSIDKHTEDIMTILVANVINEITQRNHHDIFSVKMGQLLKNNYIEDKMLPFVVGARPGNSTFGVTPQPLSSAEKIIVVENMKIYSMTEAFENVVPSSDTPLNETDAFSVLDDDIYANYTVKTLGGPWTRLHQHSIVYKCNLDYVRKFPTETIPVSQVFRSVGPRFCVLGAHTQQNQCKCRMQLTHRQCDVNLSPSGLLSLMQNTATNATGNASDPDSDFPFPFDMNSNDFARVGICDNETIVTLSDVDSGSSLDYEKFIRELCQGRKLDPALLNLSDVLFSNDSVLNVSTDYFQTETKRLSFDHRYRLPILQFPGLDSVTPISYLIFSQGLDNRVMQNGILAFDSNYCGTYDSEILSDVTALNEADVNANTANVTTLTSTISNILALDLRRAASSILVKELEFKRRGDLPRGGLTIEYFRRGPTYDQTTETPFAEATRNGLNLVGNDTLDNPDNFGSLYEYEYNKEMEERYKTSTLAQGLVANASDDNSSLTFSHVSPVTGDTVPGFSPVMTNLTKVIATQRKNVVRATHAKVGKHAVPLQKIDYVESVPRIQLRFIQTNNISAEAVDYLNNQLEELGIQTISPANIIRRSPRTALFTRNSNQLLVAGYGGCIWGNDIRDPKPCRSPDTDVSLTPAQYQAMIEDANITNSIVGRSYYLYNTDELSTEYTFWERAGYANYIQLLVPQLKMARQYNLTMDTVEIGGDENSTVFGAGREGFDPLSMPSVLKDLSTLDSEVRVLMFTFEEMMLKAGLDPYQTVPVSPRDTYNANHAGNNLHAYATSLMDIKYQDPYNSSKFYTCKRCSNHHIQWATFCEILESFCFRNNPEDVELLYSGESNPDRMDRWYFEANNPYEYININFDLPESLILSAIEQTSICPLDTSLQFPFSPDAKIEFRPTASNATQLFRLEIQAEILESCAGTTWYVIYPNATEVVKSIPIGNCKFTQMRLYKEYTFPNASEELLQDPLLCWEMQSSGTDISLDPGTQDFQTFSETTVDELRVRLLSLGLARSKFLGEINQIYVDTYRGLYPYGDLELTNMGFPISASVPLFSDVNASTNETIIVVDPLFNTNDTDANKNNSIPVGSPDLNTTDAVGNNVNGSYYNLSTVGTNVTNTTNATDDQAALLQELLANLVVLQNLKNQSQALAAKIAEIQRLQAQIVGANPTLTAFYLAGADLLASIKINNSAAIGLGTLLENVTATFWANAMAMGNQPVIENNATRQAKLLLFRKELEYKKKIVAAIRARCKPSVFNFNTDDCSWEDEELYLVWFTIGSPTTFGVAIAGYMLIKYTTRSSHACRCLVEDGFEREPKGKPDFATEATAPKHAALYEGIYQLNNSANNAQTEQQTRKRGSHQYTRVDEEDSDLG